MMNWGYGNMMDWNQNGFGWFGFFGFAFWIIILVDLILVGVWLWKKIQK